MIMILLKTNFPFAQGVFTALLIGVVLFIFKFINKGVDKTIDIAHLSTNDINKLLNLALGFLNQEKIKESVQAYNKILTIEPTNPEALTSLVGIYFVQEKFEEAEYYCERIFNHYFISMPETKKNLNPVSLSELYITIYCYGYIQNKKGQIERAMELKNISLENKEFLQDYEDLRSEIPY